MTYVIGIDGGGTKTRALLVDHDGHIYADVTTGPSNPNTLSKEKLNQTFVNLFEKLNKQSTNKLSKVTAVFAGVAGSSNTKNRKELKMIIKRFIPEFVYVHIESDALNALYSGTLGGAGIVQISGTGSISYGLTSDNRKGRVGGWGYLLGDEGSGYDIGRQGIMTALEAYDGRGIKSLLSEMIFDYFNVNTGEELTAAVYSADDPKNVISDTSRIVFTAYQQYDVIADDIIQKAVQRISENILALYQRLFQEKGRVQVILCGGVFKDPTIIPPLVKKEVNQHVSEMEVILPSMPPVGGSIIGALLVNDEKISDQVVTSLTNNFHKREKTTGTGE